MKMLAIIAMVLLTLATGLPARAQESAPPPSFVSLNADGTTTIDPSQLTPGALVLLPPPNGIPYVQIAVPGTDIQVCYGCMSFQTYSSADGYTLYAPDTYTATVMSVTGQSPFNTQPDYAVLSNQMAVAGLFGALDNMGISPAEIWSAAQDNAQTQWNQTAASGGQLNLVNDPFALIKLNVANLMSGNVNPTALIALATGDLPGAVGSSLWMNGVFVFGECPAGKPCGKSTYIPKLDKGERDDLVAAPAPQPTFRPTARPTSRPTPFPTPSVTNLTVDCPLDPSVSQDDPANTVRAKKIAPNFPVVVGQDPGKTGVTLSVSMTVPPVYYSYNVKNYHSRCEGAGCDLPPRLGPVNIITWETCDRVTEIAPDTLASIFVSANLSPASMDWIDGDLAQRYPGARVYQPHWPLFPGLAGVGGGIGTDRFRMQWDRVPLRDPGAYLVNVSGMTTGTIYSAPRAFSFSQEIFSVDLIMTALTR